MIDRTAARRPPTADTMSAKTVVVVTTRIASGSGDGRRAADGAGVPVGEPQPARAIAITTVMRPAAVPDDVRLSLSRCISKIVWPSGYPSVQLVRNRVAGLALPAPPEHLEPMPVDPEAALSLDLAHSVRQPQVVDLRGPPTARANDMMVVSTSTRDVRVLAVRKIEPLQHAELEHHLERSEQRRATDVEASGARRAGELGRGEVAPVRHDQVGERAPGRREAVAGVVEGPDDRIHLVHVDEGSITRRTVSRLSLNKRSCAVGRKSPSATLPR